MLFGIQQYSSWSARNHRWHILQAFTHGRGKIVLMRWTLQSTGLGKQLVVKRCWSQRIFLADLWPKVLNLIKIHSFLYTSIWFVYIICYQGWLLNYRYFSSEKWIELRSAGKSFKPGPIFCQHMESVQQKDGELASDVLLQVWFLLKYVPELIQLLRFISVIQDPKLI